MPNAVLPGAGLGDDTFFAHPAGQQGLADGVVDFVRARVVEVFALEVDFGAAQLFRQAPGKIKAGGAADVLGLIPVELSEKGRVALG